VWAIWDYVKKDWVREMPSKVDDGGEAILCYTSARAAKRRAAKHFGYDSYSGVEGDGWCEVRPVGKAGVR
jgi:predicted phosphoadenosine phosphosulfate sulfurtransferase